MVKNKATEREDRCPEVQNLRQDGPHDLHGSPRFEGGDVSWIENGN